MVILFPICFCIISIFLLKRVGHKYDIFPLLLLAYLVRICFSVFNIIGIEFPLSDTSDIVRFQEFADKIVEGSAQIDMSSSYVWAGMIGGIEYLTGDDVYMPLLINSLYGTLTIWYAYRISFILYKDRQKSYVVGAFLTFVPALIFTSASYLREASIVLFFTMFVFYLLKLGYMRSNNMGTVAILILTGALAALFHGAFVFLPGIAILYILYIVLRNKFTTKTLKTGFFILSIVILSISLMVTYKVGGGKVHGLYSFSHKKIWTSLLETVGKGWLGEASGLLVQFPPIFLVIAIFKFIFSPFFAISYRMYDFIRMPLTVILFLSLTKFFLKSISSSFKLRITLFYLFIMLSFYIVMFSIGSLDPNTAYRHYMKFFPVIISMGLPLGWIYRFRNTAIVINGTTIKTKILP